MATGSTRTRAAAKTDSEAAVEEAAPLDPNVQVLITQDGRAIPPATHGAAGIDPPAEGCFVLAEQDASTAQLLLRQEVQVEPEAAVEVEPEETDD